MRIETRICYVPTTALDENELHEAIIDFLKLPTMVPVDDKESAKPIEVCTMQIDSKQAKKDKKQFAEASLIEQRSNLARLILKATTSKDEVNVHQDMIIAGLPLLSIHYFSDELTESPTNVHWLPEELTEGVRIGFLPLPITKKLGSIGTWLFEFPSTIQKHSGHARKLKINVTQYGITL